MSHVRAITDLSYRVKKIDLQFVYTGIYYKRELSFKRGAEDEG